MLNPDRFFDPDPRQKEIALALYAQIADLPILSAHGHVDPAQFADPQRRFGNVLEELIQPDHYLLRMLYSQGIPFEQLLQREDPRRVWQLFCEHFYLFRGTPSALWLTQTLETVFGIEEMLGGNSAGEIYDRIEAIRSAEDFSPRKVFSQLNIQTLATTDSASDPLSHHQAIRALDPTLNILPTLRADALIQISHPQWKDHILSLALASQTEIGSYKAFLRAVEQRRAAFKALGATATDISPAQPQTAWLPNSELEAIFARALRGESSAEDAAQFSAHFLCEMARMSVEDGLVMQLHAGSYRNHNPQVLARFGPNLGFDIPVRSEFTHNLQPLLARFGNHPNLTLILYTLDESLYSRELAPLAGAYPAVRIGAPWWFQDSWSGMRRFFDSVMETAGIYNTAGFVDDARSILTIPTRHDVWRRAAANWLAGLQLRGLIGREDAAEMATELAFGLAKKVYRLPS